MAAAGRCSAVARATEAHAAPVVARQHAALRSLPFTAVPQRGAAGRRQGGGAAAATRRRRCPAPAQALLGGLSAVFKNDPAERTRKQYQARVDAINALEPDMQKLSDGQLRELTQALKQRAAAGEGLDSLLVESFAVRALWRIRQRAGWRPGGGGTWGGRKARRYSQPGRPTQPPLTHARFAFRSACRPDAAGPAYFPLRSWCARRASGCWGCAPLTSS